MKCNNCIHKNLCSHREKVVSFIAGNRMNNIMELEITECRFHTALETLTKVASHSPIPVEVAQQCDKVEDAIKDFAKRNELIKKAYTDAKGQAIICPSCKEKTDRLYKCLDCGRPVCESCGIIVSTDASKAGIMCTECWTEQMKQDDEIQSSSVKLDSIDDGFLRDIVREDIPEK